MKVRNVTRGESYDFSGADYAVVLFWWFHLGRDWRRLYRFSLGWKLLTGQPVTPLLRDKHRRAGR